MNNKYTLDNIKNFKILINKPSLVFLKWDLWSWKTTLIKHIIYNLLNNKSKITSPTYIYYHKYDNIFHFDLYRLKNYDEFFAIWWEDIIDNNEGIILVEWPDIIEKYYTPDIEIKLTKTNVKDERKITVKYNKKWVAN